MTQRALRSVRKIAVFRPNAVGDFVFALPALHALRRSYPEAEIVYLGRQWHADFLCGRPGPVDRVAVLPACPGITVEPGIYCDSAAIDGFVDQMHGQHFDLALQMFGGGRFANPFVLRLGARLSLGLRAPDAAPLDRYLPYGGLVNRRLQLLEVAALAGAAEWPMECGLQLTDADRHAADELHPPDDCRPLVLIQPCATDARRCWAPQRFAAVADALAGEGARILVNGSEAEAGRVAEVIAAMRHRAVNLAGKASLGALCALLHRSVLCVSNDTGPLHLALALGTPAVGIYWLTNLIESAPLCQQGHRSAVSVRVRCPQCGVENISTRCPHQVSFVDDVQVDEVLALSLSLYREHQGGRRC
ncbi:MAG: glycosyltransferase family 9 protein [Pseudomonadota bacterium]